MVVRFQAHIHPSIAAANRLGTAELQSPHSPHCAVAARPRSVLRLPSSNVEGSCRRGLRYSEIEMLQGVLAGNAWRAAG